MQEVATAPMWFLPIIRDRKVPVFDDHAKREAIRLRKSFETVEQCVEGARTATSDLCRAIAEFPEDQLESEISVPFGGGSVMPMADLLMMNYWNLVYHLGQINQIQLMLGDREMH